MSTNTVQEYKVGPNAYEALESSIPEGVDIDPKDVTAGRTMPEDVDTLVDDMKAVIDKFQGRYKGNMQAAATDLKWYAIYSFIRSIDYCIENIDKSAYMPGHLAQALYRVKGVNELMDAAISDETTINKNVVDSDGDGRIAPEVADSIARVIVDMDVDYKDKLGINDAND